MIRKVKYQDIDFDKYINCLDNSAQCKSYAYPHYLDIVAGKGNWELLVKDDYEAVLPVPLQKKFGLKYVILPKLCQQLGVFSKVDDDKLNQHFFEVLNAKYAVWYYAFNDANQINLDLKNRNNFLIPVGNYEEIRQKYSPKRKRKLRLDQEVLDNSERILVNNFSEVKSFIRNNSAGVEGQDLEDFINVFEAFFNQNYLKVFGFKYHHKWINMIAMYEDDVNAILLGTFNDKAFVKLSGACVLIDDAIKNYVGSRVFDFEGSDLPNVEEFFRGYRPELRPYKSFENPKSKVILKATTKIFS
ncbi:hypothetical protein [Chryseobacterium sp. POL2]|uniref:hypothetical protein n=1 Tax=Chryseobacterium sp. POL2 TaxID=2713414 RepID=UPI0013E1DF61|nr:hypothetical protein [Chryseobacterium sp. POL2]QIG90757.1 hypothetical protein G6R40_14370 [Chryseobacterium sp. POL2]